MGGFVCLCKSLKKRLEGIENSGSVDPTSISCNCGWEIDTGYAIAYGLSILEAKRLVILALGIFVEWNLIYFAGGFIPLVLTVVSASFGVPASFATVFTIQKRRQQPCFSSLKKLLKYLTVVILSCAIINVVAMASIAIYLNTRPESIAGIFNTSMMLYSEETSHKVIIDQFQFTFQCCGHTRYKDWTVFDWQKVDYASREDMSSQQIISDEEYRPLAVPFSCCNLRSMTPCFHMDLSMNRENSVNEAGCADVLSHIVLSSAAITYGVYTFLIITQIALAFLIVKIVKRPLPSGCPSICDCTEKCPSVCPLIETYSTSCSSSNGGCTSSSEPCTSSRSKNRGSGRLSTIISSRSSSSRSPSPPVITSNSKKNTMKNSTARTRCSGGCPAGGAARILPSLHTEHTVPKKRCCQKRTAGLRSNNNF